MKNKLLWIVLLLASMQVFSSQEVFDADTAKNFLKERMDTVMADSSTVILYRGKCIPVEKYTMIMQAKSAKAELKRLEEVQAQEAARLQEAQEALAAMRDAERLEAERKAAMQRELELQKALEVERAKQAEIEAEKLAEQARLAALKEKQEREAKIEAEKKAEKERQEKVEAERRAAVKARRQAQNKRRKNRKKKAVKKAAEEAALLKAATERAEKERAAMPEHAVPALEKEALTMFESLLSNKLYLKILQAIGGILASEGNYVVAASDLPEHIKQLKIACDCLQKTNEKDFMQVKLGIEDAVNDIINKNMIDEFIAAGVDKKYTLMLDETLANLIWFDE